MSSQLAKYRVRFGPWSRFVWWILTVIALWPVPSLTGVVDANGRPRTIWFFIVIPALALLWFPIGYALDRIFTPRLRRIWLERRGR